MRPADKTQVFPRVRVLYVTSQVPAEQRDDRVTKGFTKGCRKVAILAAFLALVAVAAVAAGAVALWSVVTS